MATKKIIVTVDGYGGEHTIGKLTEEQAKYWFPKGEEELIDHVMSWGDEEDSEISDDQFIGLWHENDDIDHTYGANYDLEVTIKFGDEEYVFKTRDYSVDKLKKSTTVVANKRKIKPGMYLVCFAEERGNFISAEHEVDENDKFDINDFEFITKDIRGEIYFTGVKYKGTEMSQDFDGTVGKSFNAQILNHEDLLDY